MRSDQGPNAGFVLTGVPIYPRTDAAPVEALGVRDGRVVAVGRTDAVAAELPGAPVHRLDGGAVLPAFIDPHQHALLVAIDPSVDVLRPARSIAAILAEVRRATAASRTPWVRLHGYLPLDLDEGRSPTAAELDRACPDRPVHVISRTFHESSVNSAGLDALGITATTPDPPGGRIVRDRRGRATAVLIEAASFAAEAASRADDVDWRARLADYGRLLLATGITRIADAAVPAALADEFVAVLAAVGVEAQALLVGDRIDSPALVPGGVAKVLVDGGELCDFCFTGRQLGLLTLSALRARLGPDARLARTLSSRGTSPTRDAAGRWRMGVRLTPDERLAGLLREAAASGSGLAVHAVGNGAIGSLLDALAHDRGLAADVALRIEHAMVLDPPLISAIAETGRPVVTQPGFLASHARQFTVLRAPGPLRVLPLRSLADAGAPMAFGSDYPAAELSPWVGISAAVTRTTGHRGIVLHADEALTLAEALDASTRAAARALGAADAGTLEPGARADAQWVDADPFALPASGLADIRTRATWSNGALRHGPAALGD